MLKEIYNLLVSTVEIFYFTVIITVSVSLKSIVINSKILTIRPTTCFLTPSSLFTCIYHFAAQSAPINLTLEFLFISYSFSVIRFLNLKKSCALIEITLEHNVSSKVSLFDMFALETMNNNSHMLI